MSICVEFDFCLKLGRLPFKVRLVMEDNNGIEIYDELQLDIDEKDMIELVGCEKAESHCILSHPLHLICSFPGDLAY